MAEKISGSGALPYGPFTAQVRRFLQRFASLTPEAEETVVADYRATIASPQYQAAERALGTAIARSGREAERDALGGPLLQLLRAEQVLPDAGAAPFRPIAEPALAALLAVLMQDVLTAEQVTRLYAPVEHAIPRRSL